MSDIKNRPTILIVDDVPENLDVLKSLLMTDYMVRPATNGALALRLARMTPRPDLILLDIMMPDMDGHAVCRHLKSDPLTRDIPIIFVTARSRVEDELEGLQMGAADYITKPISPYIVRARVSTQLELHRIHRELEEKNHRLYEINERLTSSMEKLSASEDRFRGLVQTIPDIVYKIDSEGRFTFLNKSIERLGYHQSDLIGRHFSEIIHEADVKLVSIDDVLKRIGPGTSNPSQKLFDERRTGVRMTMGLEIRLKTKAGKPAEVAEIKNISAPTDTVNVEVNSTGLYGDVGIDTSAQLRQYVGTVGVIRDITDRQKTHQALLDERKLLRQLINAVPLPIFFVNRDGNLIFFNEAFRNFKGIGLHQIETINLTELFNTAACQHLKQLIDSVLAADDDSTVVDTCDDIEDGSGQTRSVRTILTKFQRQDPPTSAAIAVFVDVTEQKKFTKELIKARKTAEEMAEKAEVANRAKSDFIANMSHEIRTPLNAVIGLTYLCLQTSLTDKQRDYLNNVSKSAHALLQMLTDILDFANTETGQIVMEEVSFVLDDVLHALMTKFCSKSQKKGVQLLLDNKGGTPYRLHGDARRLSQVLSHLLANAIKFTKSGQVIIQVEPVAETDIDLLFKFSVHDTGIGMSQQQIDKLFQKFSQCDTALNRDHGGIGIGLAMSQRLVALMGGDIKVESTLGQGSQFTFTSRFRKAVEPSDGVSVMDDELLPASADDDVLPDATEAITGGESLELLFRQAVALLLGFDAEVEQVVARMAPLARSLSQRERLASIQHSLSRYDYETSLTLLSQWAEEEGITV
ncbi:MAG: response regulator [Magnetococcales bacterium]|nr:response regulator [Magnetococcales bacterium]